MLPMANEDRMKQRRRNFFFSGLRRAQSSRGPQGRVGSLILASILTGCANGPTTQPVTEDQKQDEILQHPDDYNLKMDHDISGGGIGESHGLGTDIDHVLHP
jgi:hypothetical protein